MSDENTPPSPTPSPGETPTPGGGTGANPAPPPAAAEAKPTEPESAPEPTAEELFSRRICEALPQCKPYSGKSAHAAVQVAASDLVASMRRLRDEEEFEFSMLCDHTAVDCAADNQFELLYHLHSVSHQSMLMISVKIPRDNPVVPSLCEVWKIAEWQEREVYDLFGVLYDNHPDLRRVFLEDDWKGFPLRKDYQDEFMIAPEEEQD